VLQYTPNQEPNIFISMQACMGHANNDAHNNPTPCNFLPEPIPTHPGTSPGTQIRPLSSMHVGIGSAMKSLHQIQLLMPSQCVTGLEFTSERLCFRGAIRLMKRVHKGIAYQGLGYRVHQGYANMGPNRERIRHS